ncbi:sister chromatid cohesion C-terminus-domain-containing protein [Podospora conica]|nr:sister chromatid cohesion C-terminus-domain-containing protein [Schizothecium conicum]
MANPGPAAHNGPPGRDRPSGAYADPSPAFSRPFLLQEALPYSPFTSIIPFDSSVLPAPAIGSASPAPALGDLIPSQEFDSLNEDARGSVSIPKRLQQTMSQVQHLLDRANITEYKFKTGPRTSKVSSGHSSLASSLQPFSRLVYDQTAIDFQYPTLDSPNTGTANGHDAASTMPKLPKLPPTAPKKTEQPRPGSSTPKNKQAHAQNAARFEIVLPTKSQLNQAASLVKSSATPVVSSRDGSSAPPQALKAREATPKALTSTPIKSATPVSSLAPTPALAPSQAKPRTPSKPLSSQQGLSSPQKAAIAIELPSGKIFNKNEFLVVPDEPDEPVNLSSRKDLNDDLEEDDAYGDSLGLRQRADTAFHDLKVFIHQIFQHESVAGNSQSANDIIIFALDGEMTLSATAQIKAQTLISKTIALGCFKRVPVDDLLHILRLSEGALKLMESHDIKIEESWGSADVDIWLQQLPMLETSIRAARTCLRIMSGGREDKQLYPEDMIDQCLNLFKRVTDGVVMPVAETRASGNSAELFKALSSSKKKIVALLNDCHKLFSSMALLITKVDTSETVTNTLEFTASRLVFIETAHAEKDSVIDTQKFDGFRLVAMDMLCQIFLQNPGQRKGIFNEILTSLEKLPLGKRARTFKLIDGSSIQPVSALIMRLVQTSAGKVDDTRGNGRAKALLDDDEEEDKVMDVDGVPVTFTIRDEEHAAYQHSTAIQELSAIAPPLMKAAQHDASHVINFIVNRALNSTKSGDTPYRNLLDLFVEDFTSCLDNPDWPASELLLRLLMGYMVKLLDGEKNGVTARNMALELLGVMGAAISKLRTQVRKMANALDTRDADGLGAYLTDLALSALEQRSRAEQMVAWVGPYRATLEYLESRFSEDPHLASAISFIVCDWGTKVCTTYDDACEGDDDSAAERDREFGRTAYRLREMIQDRRWLAKAYSFKEVSPNHAKLAWAITALRSQLCENFNNILNILLNSMSSDQPTVRSRSLKSVNQVLDTDSSILDGESVVVGMILRCSSDPSTQVRDSALGLIGKCIGLRPLLEDKMIGTVLERFNDAGHGVRKRAMKLAKDIYLRNTNRIVRSAIASQLLHRVIDPEESVRDLARLMIEEIWFSPFQNGENSAASKTSLADHVALMVHTVKKGNVAGVLDKVLQTLLAPTSKTAAAILEVCTKLVAGMFELVDNADSEDPSAPSGRDALQVLVIFTRADASLVTFEQLCLLKPYISTLTANDSELAVSRAVVNIYRRVLPHLSSAHKQFLLDIQTELLPTVSKATRTLLDDIFACLWITGSLTDSLHKLARLGVSSLLGIQKLRAKSKTEPLSEQNIRQFDRYSLIVGMIGKHIQLDSEIEAFKEKFPRCGDSVSKLMVDTVVPFVAENFPAEIRKAALDSVGLVCQSWPRNYANANVYTTFQIVFDKQVPKLEEKILLSIKEFLLAEEKRSEQDPDAAHAAPANGIKAEKKRELTVIGGTNYDDVASAMTQRFLKEVIRIATSTQGDHAFLALEVLSSISRQGLTHPRETGTTFITLMTSSNPKISELAFVGHQALHAKHETVLEREYVPALQNVFSYQRDVVKDPRGAIRDQRGTGADPFIPKLHLLMEVLKISKAKFRQRFFEKLCGQIDFELTKLDMAEEVPHHVQYSRFIIENIAYVDYLTVGDLHMTVSALEKLVSSTGASVAQVIESEVFSMRMDALDSNPAVNAEGEAQPKNEAPKVSAARLRQLTAASMVLLMTWAARTHLRRLYNMGTSRKDHKVKAQAKDLSKPAVKSQGVSGEKVWDEMTAISTGLTSTERMMETCKSFVELMNVDNEFLVQDDDEMNGEDAATPSGDEDEGGEQATGRGRKRKALGATPGGRKKRARSSSQQPRKRGRPRKQSAENMEAEDDMEDWA